MRAQLFIAGRQLWNRKLLNGIAVAGVMLGVLTLVGITGIMRGFQGKFLDTILAITPHAVMFDTTLGEKRPIIDVLEPAPTGVTKVLRQTSTDRQRWIGRPSETLASIRARADVVDAAPVVVGSAVASAGSKELPVELRGISPDVQDRVTPLRDRVVEGSYDSLAGSVDGAFLGTGLAELLGVHVGDNIACASARGTRATLRVVGVFDTGVASLDKGRIYVPMRVAQSILGRGDTISRIEVRLVDPQQAPVFVGYLEHVFGYDAESWQETNASMLGVFEQQNMITGMIIGAVLLVGGFGILSIQIMIVLDKRRDIALLKSVGYSSRDVLTIFLAEGAVVAVLGAAVGAVAGHFVLDFLRGIESASGMGYTRKATFAIYEEPIVYALAFTFAVGVGLLASLVPAWRASRVEPVDVLRGS